MKLEQIKDPQFLKQMNIEELEELAQDIRTFIIQNVSQTGDIFPVIWGSLN